MAERWSVPGLPHKGWTCIGVEDLGVAEACCEACGKEQLRYVHFMQHPEIEKVYEVGCVCAEKLELDYANPDGSRAKAREARMRNDASRRKRWPDLSGWKISKSGNPWIQKDGHRIVILSAGKRHKFMIVTLPSQEKYYSPRSYISVREAQLAAFDAFTYLQND